MRLIWGVSSKVEWYNNFTMPPLTMWNEILTSQTQWQIRISFASKAIMASDHMSPPPQGNVCPCQSLPSWHSVNTCFCPTQLWETWDIVLHHQSWHTSEQPTDYNGMWSREAKWVTQTPGDVERRRQQVEEVDPWSFNVFLKDIKNL